MQMGTRKGFRFINSERYVTYFIASDSAAVHLPLTICDRCAHAVTVSFIDAMQYVKRTLLYNY